CHSNETLISCDEFDNWEWWPAHNGRLICRRVDTRHQFPSSIICRKLILEDIVEHASFGIRERKAQHVCHGGCNIDVPYCVELCSRFYASSGGDKGCVHVVRVRQVPVRALEIGRLGHNLRCCYTVVEGIARPGCQDQV